MFPFFADAGNLEQLTPPQVRFAIATPQPIEMFAGQRIDYRIRVRGIPMRWTSEISTWQPPHAFVDEQRRGPYRLWHHRHEFTPIPGGTRLVDIVHYAVPGWWLEPVVHRLAVRPDLTRIFRFRGEKIVERFGLMGAPPTIEFSRAASEGTVGWAPPRDTSEMVRREGLEPS